MKRKSKKLISICLSMLLAFSLALPVYAGSATSGCVSNIEEDENFEFDEETGHLTIGKMIEKKKIHEINSIPKDNIQSVTIRDGVTSIGDSAFQNCINLKEVTIPDSVKYIGKYAFQNCISLKQITIPNSVKEIHFGAFGDCTGLTSITIPNSVKYICAYTFYGCTSLKQIIIPDSVTSIGEYAFDGCTSLTSVTIKGSTEFHWNTFDLDYTTVHRI